MFNRAGFNREIAFNRPTKEKYLNATFEGAGALTAEPLITAVMSATTFEGAGTMTAKSIGGFSATFSGAGDLIAAAAKLKTMGATFEGAGTMEALITFFEFLRMEYQGVLEPGDVITFNTENKTVLKNGQNFLLYFAGEFFDLQPGANNFTWQDTESARDLTLEVSYTDRYV